MGRRKDKNSMNLFNDDETVEWKKHWKGMPEYIHKDLAPFSSVVVNFNSRKDMDEFAALINQKITRNTKFVWYPETPPRRSYKDREYIDEKI